MKNRKKKIPRNGAALAAKNRKSGGPMKHRLEPKGGAKNEMKEFLEEADQCTCCNDPDDPDDKRILQCDDCPVHGDKDDCD